MGIITFKLVTNDGELKSAFDVRRKVFVEEQGISEDIELDEHDREALHIIARDGERVIGTARVLFLVPSQAKIERMAILKPFRGKGIGSKIISFLDETLRNRQINQVFLHAQYPVVGFYRSCGFKESGSPFREAGIRHIKMQKRL
jgi:predicted GNAT family N-acyltransferase